MKCILCCWVINSILPMQILAPIYLTLQRGIFQKLPSSAAQESQDCCNLINLCPVSSEAEPVFWIGALCVPQYVYICMVQYIFTWFNTDTNHTIRTQIQLARMAWSCSPPGWSKKNISGNYTDFCTAVSSGSQDSVWPAYQHINL